MLAQTEATLRGQLAVDRTRYGDDVIVVSLAGEFDLSSAAAAEAMLDPVRDDPCAMTVLDLTELEFIDSSGVAFLYDVARSHPDKESLRVLPSRHGGVNRVLELTDVGAVIPIVSSAP
jgi:anti-sigma B factor antagonist